MLGSLLVSSQILRGGVWYNLSGATPAESIETMVRTIKLPKDTNRERLKVSLLDREALVPTAMGAGIAMPHPRALWFEDPQMARVAVFFMEHPVEWDAPDGQPVQVAFLVLSADRDEHLETLSALSRACGDPAFMELLRSRPGTEELAAYFSAPAPGTSAQKPIV